MYYIIRTVIFIILGLLLTFSIIKIRKKSKKHIMNGSINEEKLKKYSKFSYKFIYFLICAVIIYCIMNAVKFPIEQYFLSFDSETDAFHYYLIDNSIMDRYENKNSIFYVDNKNKIYGLTKSNEKFSYLDYKNIDVNYNLNNSMNDIKFSDGSFNILNSDITVKYNKSNNITFYYIAIEGINDDMRNEVTINDEPAKLAKTKTGVIPTTEIEYKKYYYTYFSEGAPYENIRIETHNKISSFVRN